MNRNENSVTTAFSSPIDRSRLIVVKRFEIVGDALVGVVGRRLVELHAVIGPVAEPVAEEPLGQPAPPADLQDPLQIELIDGDDDHRRGDHPEDRELPPEFRPVVFLQRVVEIVVPGVEADVEPD